MPITFDLVIWFKQKLHLWKLLSRPFEWYIINLIRWCQQFSIVFTYDVIPLFYKFLNRNLWIYRKATWLLNLVHLITVIPKLKKKNWKTEYLEVWLH